MTRERMTREGRHLYDLQEHTVRAMSHKYQRPEGAYQKLTQLSPEKLERFKEDPSVLGPLKHGAHLNRSAVRVARGLAARPRAARAAGRPGHPEGAACVHACVRGALRPTRHGTDAVRGALPRRVAGGCRSRAAGGPIVGGLAEAGPRRGGTGAARRPVRQRRIAVRDLPGCRRSRRSARNVGASPISFCRPILTESAPQR